MTPEDLLSIHVPPLVSLIRKMTVDDFDAAVTCATLGGILESADKVESMPPHREPVPGEDSFWWCVETMLLLTDSPHPNANPSLQAWLDELQRIADLAEARQPLPEGYTVDWPERGRAPSIEHGPDPNAPQSRFGIKLRMPMDAGELASFALRAVLCQKLPWLRQCSGEHVPVRELFPLDGDGRGFCNMPPNYFGGVDIQGRAMSLAGRVFSRIAAREGPGLRNACKAEGQLLALAPGAQVEWDRSEPGTVRISSGGWASLDACAEVASALIAEGGLDPVAFEWVEWDDGAEDIGNGNFRTGWTVCTAQGPERHAAVEAAEEMRRAASLGVEGSTAVKVGGKAKRSSPTP